MNDIRELDSEGLASQLEFAYSVFDQSVNPRDIYERNSALGVGLIPELNELRVSGDAVHGTGHRFGNLEWPHVFHGIEGKRTALIMDHGGVKEVLGNEDRFVQDFYAPLAGKTLIHLNGPPHRRYRKLLNPVFGPRSMNEWETTLVPDVLEQIFAPLDRQNRIDLISIIYSYPARVFCRLLDLSEEDVDQVRALGVLGVAASADPAAAIYLEKLAHFLHNKVQARRRTPPSVLRERSDLISLLVATQDGDDQLTDEEIVATLTLLVTAGVDTTAHLFANSLYMYLMQPEVAAEVSSDHSLIAPLMEETIRLIPAGGNIELRKALCDMTVSGIDIAEGMGVMTCETTANRDRKLIADPDTFDLHRTDRTHLSFGFGPHTCIGQHLGRLEVRSAIRELLRRFPDIRFDPDFDAPHITGMLFQHPSALPVVLRP